MEQFILEHFDGNVVFRNPRGDNKKYHHQCSSKIVLNYQWEMVMI